MNRLVFIFIFALLASEIAAGPIAYAICQTGCNAMVVACYAGAGFVFGTGKKNTFLIQYFLLILFSRLVTAGAGVPAAIIACNTALGVCMAACVAAGFTPTP